MKLARKNIILTQAYFDEDTPHLQSYFLPVVKEVRRKYFVKDNKIVYEIVKGNFLNNDQFWKQRGD